MKFRITLNGEVSEAVDAPAGLSVNGRQLEHAELHRAGDHEAELTIGNRIFRINMLQRDDGVRGVDSFTLWVNGERFDVQVLNERAMAIEKFAGLSAERSTSQKLVAPMPGLVVRVNVAVGDSVAPGQGLVVMEAMKMENELRVPKGGIVRSIHVQAGRPVEKGALLMELDPS